MGVLEAFVLGVLEGLTEFLPISSTGHLILASWIMNIKQTEAHKAFEVAIQLGSILAVVFLYKNKLFSSRKLWERLIIAFIPTGALGFLLYKIIKSLFSPYVVATMLIVGGIIFIIVELLYKEKEHHISNVEEIPYIKAFFIGVFQSFAMVPGTSRSGATIIGGLLLGLNRKTAAEFSFLLAVPTMFVATAYDILKHHNEFQVDNWINLGIGFFTAFVFAVISIKLFLAFISRYNFIPFGVYRIVVGIIFLLFFL
ncbi:undecaprenyl-diphosphate phosphatase [Hydrogenivirga sp. 128-5-R1-1]|uniref:undecaprenyl-diphosphate phosphatase n=1 Tax=Hydrogenivirga sp. 128-5-R1-1 TaxID=392423 RepID=UPI00015F14E3|nr:undecaprenyl-diphosphate phosphatase [Hydrogenivirga sp. 128-5-R1-1]EDP74264.1 putative undecaprenol kinase bacitracin resistance protein [Hydrogenivirga sp. 128-5-R1-1]